MALYSERPKGSLFREPERLSIPLHTLQKRENSFNYGNMYNFDIPCCILICKSKGLLKIPEEEQKKGGSECEEIGEKVRGSGEE